MTTLIFHSILLALLSHAASRRLVAESLDRVIATALLFWGNIVATGLLLSCLTELGNAAWFFRASLLLGGATFLGVRAAVPHPAAPAASDHEPRSRPLLIFVLTTLGAILGSNLVVAAIYEPSNYDSLTYHLPRVLYYLGHGSLAHFEAADFRQVFYPFNFNLLQLLCFLYDAPAASITFLNVLAWALAGVSVFRISRLCGCSFNGSLVAAWLALTSTAVLAQATSTILDLPAGTALAATLHFVLRWRAERRPADALLAGLAASLGAGTKLTAAFFAPAAALLIVVIAWRHWRSGATGELFRGVHAWIVPALLAAVLCAPFVIYNLKATGQPMTHGMDFTLNKPFTFGCAFQTAKGYLVQMFCEPLGRYSFNLEHIDHLNRWFARHVFTDWNPAYAFSDLYLIPPDLNEDHVWFGLAGPFFILCAVWCLGRDLRLQRPMSWVALLGLGWFAFYFATNKWSLYNQRYFVPVIIGLGPCAAALWDARAQFPRLLRPLLGLAQWIVILSSLWFAGHYLVNNNSRPLPLFRPAPTQALPEIPETLSARLAEQPRIQVSSYGTNERIFPILHLGHRQRVTSGSVIHPENYILFSFWEATRNYIYSNLAYYASYTLVPVPAKRSAGLEFLGSVIGSGDAFDYVGFPAHANDAPPTATNHHIGVIVEYSPDTNDPVRLGRGRVRIIGLNPRDATHVIVRAERADGTAQTLVSVAHNDWTNVSVEKPFRRLAIEVVDDASGQIIGRGELPFTVRQRDLEMKPMPTAGSIFSTEIISGEAARQFTVSGLAPLEGPYPQWDLPAFRWAKEPTVRLVLPPNPECARIRLKLTARPQVRDAAVLEIIHNGQIVRTCNFTDRAHWLTEVIEVPAAPGTNTFELRDRTSEPIPDWLAYLDRNPDVKQHLESQGRPLEAGAKEHYELHGRAEGRTLPARPGSAAPPRDSLYLVYRNLRLEGFPTP